MPVKSAVRRIQRTINKQAIAQYNAAVVPDSQSFEHSQQRNAFIQNCLEKGGKPFVDRVKRYGCNEKGEPLRLTQSFLEYLEAIGDFRLHHTLTTGCSQLGKAQPLNARIVTPSGFRLMGNIQKNDKVIAADGTHATVLDVFPQGTKEIYRVWFCDGTYADCCNDHLWLTQTSSDRRVRVKNLALQPRGTRQRDWDPLPDGSKPGSVKTLKEIRETLYLKYEKNGKLKTNHSVPLCSPVEYESGEELIIPPYTMGILLGDWQIVTTLKGYYTRSSPHYYREEIKKLRLSGLYSHEKFVPLKYMQASTEDRLALLQGLLDSDGTCNASATGNSFVEFCCTSKALTDAVVELTRSLGGYAKQSKSRETFYYGKNREKIAGKTAYRTGLRLPPSMKPFRLERKLENWKPPELRRLRKYIERVEKLDDAPAQCILVDHPEHLYLTENFTVTHNTIGHTLLLIDTGVHGKLNIGWFYASRDSRELNVQEQFRPTVEAWVDRLQAETGAQIGIEGDRKLNSRYQVDGTTFIFSYTSTSKRTPGRDGLAAAGGAAVSFTANVLFYEERSQWLPGTADPLIRRLDASLIPTRPIRELGTPGAGQGIEAELEQVDRYFYPHYTCEKCGTTAPLDPKGCLLKPITRTLPSGDVKRSYLSESGRPLQWWSKAGDSSVDGAYFGCVECGYPISDQQRVEDAWFQCKQTGVTLRRFLDELPLGVPRSPLKIGLHISPLTRQTKYNLATTIIRDGLTCLRTEDWQQQGLGHPSENVQNSVSLEVLKSAITASKPTGKPAYTLAGIDQGRSEDWLMIVDFYVPEHLYRLSVAEIIDQSIRVIRFGGDVTRDATPAILNTYGVTYGLIDNEPDRTSNANLCADTCLELADQRSGLMNAVKAGIVHDSGREYPCWYIRNEKFLKQVLNGFVLNDEHGYPLYRLPEEWEKWLGTPTERSPLKHLMGPNYDNETGKWKRGKGNLDDLYYALMFCEAAFYLSLTEKSKKTGADLLW